MSYCRRQQVCLVAKPSSSNNNKGRRRRCQSSSAAALDIGIAQMAAGGGAWPPQQWAMLTEDTVVCHVDRYGGIHQPVPNEISTALKLRNTSGCSIEGNWGDDAHLQRRWADDIINEQWASVNARRARCRQDQSRGQNGQQSRRFSRQACKS